MVNLVRRVRLLVQRRRRRPRRNPPERYQFGRWGGREARAARREKRKRAPYRIDWFPGGGYHPGRCWDGKSCAAHRAAAGEPCARRISWCARRDRSPSDSNRSPYLPAPLHCALPGHGDRAHVAEAPQAVLVARAHGELNHFQRAAKVHVQAAFFRFAIERCGAMNHGIRGAHQPRDNRLRLRPKCGIGEIAAENMDSRIRDTLRSAGNPCAAAANATGARALPARRARAPAGSADRNDPRADSTRCGHRYIRWTRSGRWPQWLSVRTPLPEACARRAPRR